MKTLKELTQQDVIDLIYYDPITGKCYWRVRGVQWFKASEKRSAQHECNRWNSRYAGKEINTIDDKGYYRPFFLEKPTRLHRVIWFYMTGGWPSKQIDHINGIRTDNRWENLREVTNAENTKNRKRSKNNKTGVSGVTKCRTNRKWLARINQKGMRIHLGYFNTYEEAVTARKTAEIKYSYHKNNGRD